MATKPRRGSKHAAIASNGSDTRAADDREPVPFPIVPENATLIADHDAEPDVPFAPDGTPEQASDTLADDRVRQAIVDMSATAKRLWAVMLDIASQAAQGGDQTSIASAVQELFRLLQSDLARRSNPGYIAAENRVAACLRSRCAESGQRSTTLDSFKRARELADKLQASVEVSPKQRFRFVAPQFEDALAQKIASRLCSSDAPAQLRDPVNVDLDSVCEAIENERCYVEQSVLSRPSKESATNERCGGSDLPKAIVPVAIDAVSAERHESSGAIRPLHYTYPPNMRDRDKFIYESVDSGLTKPAIIADLERICSQKCWDPISTADGIRDAADRYAEKLNLPKIRRRGGRPRRNANSENVE